MYRSRLGKNLGKVTLDYVSSLNDDVEIAHHDILGSQAHTIMLYENKIITKKEVKKILKGLEDLKKAIENEDGKKLEQIFTKTKKIRKDIVKAGQDVEKPDFGRKS